MGLPINRAPVYLGNQGLLHLRVNVRRRTTTTTTKDAVVVGGLQATRDLFGWNLGAIPNILREIAQKYRNTGTHPCVCSYVYPRIRMRRQTCEY